MFTATKIESTIRPKSFEPLNNGVWYYNYGIVEKAVQVKEVDKEQEQEEIRYEYVQVRINGVPTLSKCCQAVLSAFKDEAGTSAYDAIQLGTAQYEEFSDIYYAVRVDFGMEEAITPLEKAKKEMIKKIDEYDSSSEVNSFYLNGFPVWLDKGTRVGLMNSLTIEETSGKEQSTLWFNNICIVINCGAAIQMLKAIELYALDCYNKTAEHKVAVNKLTDINEVINYDYTTGYPTKLNLTV